MVNQVVCDAARLAETPGPSLETVGGHGLPVKMETKAVVTGVDRMNLSS
jgi:hypothetical protein